MDKKWEGFLSYLCPPVSYLMSVTVSMLVPLSNYTIELNKIKNENPILYKKLVDLNTEIVNEIIMPIVEEGYKSLNPIPYSYIQSFINYSKKEIDLLSSYMDVKKAEKSNIQYYKNCIDRLEKQQRLSKNSVKTAIDLVNILTDYMKTIVAIMENRKSFFLKVFEDMDLNDLAESLYGTTLAFLCINVILNKKWKEEERFSSIVEAGFEYAKNLDAYIDTLDVLTNPEEDQYLRNIKE